MAKTRQQQKDIQAPTAKIKTSVSVPGQKYYALIIFAFSFLLYFNSTFNDYNLDDELVTQNHHLTSQGISAIPEIFNSPYYSDQAGYKYEYRPIVLVSFAIEHTIFGDNAHISHVINLLLYSLMCVLLFQVLKKVFRKYNALFPFIITLLFAAHPIHTEVVDSIKNRDEILALIFALLSLDCALRYLKRKNIFWFILMPFLFYIGILSKPTIITFALIIPLTLIMFSEASFITILVTTTVLAIPATLYSRLNFISYQVGFVIALLMSVSFFYALRHITGLGQLWNMLKASLAQFKNEPAVLDSTEPADADLNVYKRPGLMIPFVLVSGLLIVAAALGSYATNFAMSTIPIAMLCLLFLAVRIELRLLLMPPITLITLLAFTKYGANGALTETTIMCFLASQYFTGGKRTRQVAIFCYALLCIVAVIFHHSYFIPVAILMYAGFVNKKLMPLGIAVAVASGIGYLVSVYQLIKGTYVISATYFALPLLYIPLLLLFINKRSLLKLAGIILVPVCFFIYFLMPAGVANHSIGAQISNVSFAINYTHGVDPTPVQAVRPLKYVEIPVDSKSPLNIKLGTAGVVLGHYLRLIVAPFPMSYYYGYAYIVPTDVKQPVPILVFVFYFILLLVALFLFKRLPVISYALLFYIITIVVFSNLFVAVPGLLGDRFLLVPSIGFAILVTAIITLVLKQDLTAPKLSFSSIAMPVKVSVGVILVCYSLITFARNNDWKDRLVLFRHDIHTVENSAQAHNLLGVNLLIAANQQPDAVLRKQMIEEAIGHLKRTLQIYPDFFNASYDLARAYTSINQLDSAYVAYQNSIRLNDKFYLIYFSMAMIDDTRGRLEASAANYEKYLQYDPGKKEAYASLSYAYFRMKDYDRAISTNQKLIKIMPNTYEPWENIGKTYLTIGKADSARYYFEHEYTLTPNNRELLNTLVQLCTKAGDTQKAAFYQQKLNQVR